MRFERIFMLKNRLVCRLSLTLAHLKKSLGVDLDTSNWDIDRRENENGESEII